MASVLPPPGLSDLQKSALNYIRAHPNCGTSDVAVYLKRPVKAVRGTLDQLVDKGLVGRQWGFGPGEYESKWLAEL